jgi:serine protease Do
MIKSLPLSNRIGVLLFLLILFSSGVLKEENVTASVELYKEGIPKNVLSLIEAVVCIEAVKGEKTEQYSGFFIDGNGTIISTTHNLDDFDQFAVGLHDGRNMKGKIIRFDRHKDLSLIKIDFRSTSHVLVSKGRKNLQMGEQVYSLGCPLNLVGTVFTGIVNGPPRRVDDLTYWQVNMEIHPGSSGSPVFDANGSLVGVVKGRYRGTHSIGFLIPLDAIAAFMSEK